MSSISSTDVSSILQALTGSSSTGLNVSALVSAAASAARAPEKNWMVQQSLLKNENSLLSQATTAATSLYDDMKALSDPTGVMTSLSANSSDYGVVSASVASGAVAGSHIISVTHVAQTASKYLKQAYASGTTALPSGSFQIHGLGGTRSATVTIGSGVNTLNDVAKYINDQKIGVNASVVTDSLGAHLALVSTGSGLVNDFTIDNVSTTTDGEGNTVPFLDFEVGVAAQDASVKVDGIPISSSTNTITGALAGVTINVNSAAKEDSTATITVGPSTSSMSSAINKFVSDYNSLVTGINSQFKYDPSTGTSGGLSTNTAFRSLQSDLLNSMTYSTSDSNGGIRMLSSLGITMNNDGTLTVDGDKLNNALTNNKSAVQTFFQGTASNGFANKVANTLDIYTDTSEGAFTIDIKTNKGLIDDLQDDIDDREAYIAEQQVVWSTKYGKAAAALLELPSQLKQIDAMLGNDDD